MKCSWCSFPLRGKHAATAAGWATTTTVDLRMPCIADLPARNERQGMGGLIMLISSQPPQANSDERQQSLKRQQQQQQQEIGSNINLLAATMQVSGSHLNPAGAMRSPMTRSATDSVVRAAPIQCSSQQVPLLGCQTKTSHCWLIKHRWQHPCLSVGAG